MPDDETADVRQIKASLCRLAGPDDRQIVERAIEAIGDIEAAATFVEQIGLAELEAAIERIDDPELESHGRETLETFRRFRTAAAGELPADHFHSARATDLRGDPERSIR